MADDWLEKQIKKAQEEGKFDNLKGKGERLTHLDSDPLDHVLQAQGFKARWAELEQEIQQKIDIVQQGIKRTHEWATEAASGSSVDRSYARDEWLKARILFNERLDEINELIKTFNLILPARLVHLQRFPLKEEEMLQQLGLTTKLK